MKALLVLPAILVLFILGSFLYDFLTTKGGLKGLAWMLIIGGVLAAVLLVVVAVLRWSWGVVF